MANVIDKEIKRGDSWNNYKGSRIQEYIENELDSKVGAFYKPDGGTRVYCFANEDDKAKYLETGDASLVLQYFDTMSNYDVLIDSENLQLSHSVIDGATGNTLEFRFKIVDKNGMSADAKASIEFSFTGSGISNKFTTEVAVAAGDWTSVSELVDNYLRSGSNSVAVKIVGLTTNTTTQFIMTYNLFDLSFIPTFKFNEPQMKNALDFTYSIKCSDPKYLEFYLDGKQVSSKESMAINDIEVNDGHATLDISTLERGQHSLQVRAYVKASDGTLFYTPSHFYTFAKGGEADPSYLMQIELDNNQPIVGEGEALSFSVNQFEQIVFDWSVYSYEEGRAVTAIFEYNGSEVTRGTINNYEEARLFSYRPMLAGNDVLRVYAMGEFDETLFDYTININVKESSSGIKETTEGLLLKLQATGHRNDENKEKWECVGIDGERYFATFNGFSWNSQQGWDEEDGSLTVSNGASVSFNIQPMANDWAKNGGTFEIDIETFDVDDEDTVICECSNNIEGVSSASFKITATNAIFRTAQGKEINTRFKEKDRLKIAFIGNKVGPHEDGNLIYIVVNGVLERAALYDSTDSIYSFANLVIGGNVGAKARIRSIRVYNKAITVDQAFNNFVVDSDDVQVVYERNNVLAAGSMSEIGFEEVANKIPVMIFTGDMVELAENGQDKEWRQFDVEYINRQQPELNFVSFNARLKLQGTSSLGYPRKNFKLSTKDKNFNKDLYNASTFKYELDPNSVSGNLMLRNKITGEVLDFNDFKTNGTLRNSYCVTLNSNGEPLKKGKYRFRKGAHKADKWTLKADFMESSGAHNVGAGRSWNDIFENTELLSNGDNSYSNNTYKDSALVSNAEVLRYTRADGITCAVPNNTQAIKDQKKYVCRTDAQKICIASDTDDVRTAVDGFPMVCFYRTSHAENNLIFMGQYNFINDKSSYEVFGFEDIEDPADAETMIYDADKVEVWEGLKNTNPISLFQVSDTFFERNDDDTMFKWQETYESRYPDPDDYGDLTKKQYNPNNLYELTKWLVSTRHDAITNANKDEVLSDTPITIDSWFAERINTYQYGYTDDTAQGYVYAKGEELPDTPANRQKKFETEKWEHFDVWKLAGYYIYLRRYGAVDQFVKNTMLFTDGNGKYDPRTDGKYRKWFFINYDNDCLFGLRNNGQLAFDWKLDRQTRDAASDILVDDQADNEAGANAFAMMGHDSTLWNNLEADDEFMRMVRDLDYSMTKYKLNYEYMVEQFDTEQTEKWCERIYNANERYKYIYTAKGLGDVGDPVNNLWMLQGTRRSHRHWWIANHFNLLDAQWLSGSYKNTYVEIKTSCEEGDTAHCIAGDKYYFAWGQQKKIYESNMEREAGEAVDFVMPYKQSQGDPVYIYAFNKMSEMDFSDLAPYVYEGSFKFVLGNDMVSNTLKKLVIGNPKVSNSTAQDTTTWSVLSNLEHLDITNYAGITSVPTVNFPNLKVFKAKGSKLGSFLPAEGSRFEVVELPNTIKTLNLNGITFVDNINANLDYTPNTNLSEVVLANSDGIGMDYYNKIVAPWINVINASAQSAALYQTASLTISNIKWSFSNLDSIRIFKTLKSKGKMKLSGTINLASCGNLSMDNINEIKSIFGENCFNPKTSSLYVITPDSVFMQSDGDSVVAKENTSHTFRREVYPDENAIAEKLQSVKYYIVEETDLTKLEEPKVIDDIITGKHFLVVDDIASVRRGLSLVNTLDEDGKQIGVISSKEIVLGRDTTFTVLVKMDVIGGVIDKVSFMDFTVLDPTYAATASINGSSSAYKGKEYTYTLIPRTADDKEPLGTYTVEWSYSGEALEAGYIESYGVSADNQLQFKIKTSSSQPEVSSMSTLKAVVTNYDGTTAQTTFNILALNETVIMTVESNPSAMAVCNEMGWTTGATANAMTKAQAEAVTDVATMFRNYTKYTFDFTEFAYFTGITSLDDYAFAGSNITSIALPSTITSIGAHCFDGCSKLKDIFVVDGDNEYGETIYNKSLPNGIKTIKEGCFKGCKLLNEMILPDSVISIEDFAFGGTNFTRALLHSQENGVGILNFPTALKTIAPNAFESEAWTPATTTNKLKELSIPASTVLEGRNILLGKEFNKFFVEEDNISYAIDSEGALCSKNGAALLRYLPKKESKVFEYVAEFAESVSDYSFFAVKNLDTAYVKTFGGILGTAVFESSDIRVIDLTACNNAAGLPTNTFYDCKKLEHVYLPNMGSLKTIGTHCFDGCESLKEINLPNSIVTLQSDKSGNSNTFVHCDSLTNLILPDHITEMGHMVVSNCKNLKSVTLPKYWNGMATQSNVICGCDALEDVTLSLFSYTNEEDEDIVLNETMNWSIVSGDCKAFAKYIIPSEDNGKVMTADEQGILYTIGKICLRVPYAATAPVIAEGTIKLDGNAFAGCAFVGITLPESLTELYTRCFNKMPLEKLVIPSGIEEIPYGMCLQCTSLTEVVIKSPNLRIIERFAFGWCPNLSKFSIYSPIAPQLSVGERYDSRGEAEGVREFHPFGYAINSSIYYMGYNTRKNGNVFYIPYNAVGYEGEVWEHPLLDAEKDGFTMKYLPVEEYSVVLKVYHNGELKTDGSVFLKSESGEMVSTDGTNAKVATYIASEGGYVFNFLNDAYHNEVITVYANRECTEIIGTFTVEQGTTEYTVGDEAIMASSSPKAQLFSTGLFGSSVLSTPSLVSEEKMANITESEYYALLGKIDLMMGLLKKLK